MFSVAPSPPIVLHELVRGQQRVAACSRSAAALGVRLGMPVAEILAAFPEAVLELPGQTQARRGDCLDFRARPRIGGTTVPWVLPYEPELDRAALESLAEWCEQFSPTVGIESTFTPDSLLLDITGLAHLFGVLGPDLSATPRLAAASSRRDGDEDRLAAASSRRDGDEGESAFCDKVVAAFALKGLMVRVAVAGTVGAAWALAHYGPSEGDCPDFRAQPRSGGTKMGLSPLADSLASLPVAALRLPSDTLDLLGQLGVERIEQLERLPREELPARLGPEVLRRLDQASGRAAEPVAAHRRPPELQAEFSLEFPTARSDVIEALADRLLRSIARELDVLGRGVLRLECRLDYRAPHGDCPDFRAGSQRGPTKMGLSPLPQARCQTVRLSVGLFEPSASPDHLRQLLALELEHVTLPGLVVGMSVAAVATAPIHHRQQSLFDEPDRPSPRALGALVERLSGRLGARQVLGVRLAHEALPELAWRGVALVGQARAAATSAPVLPPRPLVLFRQPEPLTVRSVVPEGPPVQFQYQGQRHPIVESWGPERIETGWWRGQMVGRDYYRVETVGGSRYWLFRHRPDGRWFLHGRFE